jgi:hypothetical protein
LDRGFGSILLQDESPPIIRIESFSIVTRTPQVDTSCCLPVLREKIILTDKPMDIPVLGGCA